MIETERILFLLKRSLLEYGLKYRIDYLVQRFSCDENTNFEELKISSVRFQLYNLYIIVKHKNFSHFDQLIDFLNVFNENFPLILDEKLYLRVLVSLKALYIYECLRSGDLKRSSQLIKEYFPDNGNNNNALNLVGSNKEKSVKSTLEFKILKLRSEWNQLILNKTKREIFFEKNFLKQYDDEFLSFLLKKVNGIIDVINAELPPTQIEEMMHNQFANATSILLEMNDNDELELEDEVRIQLFIDNLRLHKLFLESSKENTYLTKYLKKNFKILMEWQLDQLNSSQFGIDNSQSASQSMGQKSIVHEVLYLDSQFSDLQAADEIDEETSYNLKNKRVSFDKIVPELNNITNDLTNAQTTYNTALISFESFKNANSIKEIISTSDLITDDEKE